MTKLKEEIITPLTVKSNYPKWFFIIRFSFASTSVHRTNATLIIMKINDLEEFGFNKVMIMTMKELIFWWICCEL